MEDFQETRSGIVFFGRITGDIARHQGIYFGDAETPIYLPVRIFREDDNRFLKEIPVSCAFASLKQTALEEALKTWITQGDFRDVITEPDLLRALTIYRDELAEGILPEKKTYRLLLAKSSRPDDPRFILTDDASHLADLEKQKSVYRQKLETERQARIAYSERQLQLERLEREHSGLTASLAKAIMSGETADTADIRRSKELDIHRSSPIFRSTRFPNEASILWFDFTQDGVRHAGFVGFDHNPFREIHRTTRVRARQSRI